MRFVILFGAFLVAEQVYGLSGKPGPMLTEETTTRLVWVLVISLAVDFIEFLANLDKRKR